MTILRILLFIWFFWWIIKKLLNYLSEKVDDSHLNSNDDNRSKEFKARNMDVQDAEFEELDESN